MITILCEHDITKRHFDDCKSKTGVLNKPEKSRNMIVAPKGCDSIREHLGEHTALYKLVLPSTGCVHRLGY